MEKARNRSHELLMKAQKLPGGLALFSRIICLRAPYFSSISPRMLELRPGYARARMRKRRGVTNHLGGVHAIAMANLCEFVGGVLMEISVPAHMRWIPKGMDIRYLARAGTDLTAECQIDFIDWDAKQDVTLSVEVEDRAGQTVAHAHIPMYVSPRER